MSGITDSGDIDVTGGNRGGYDAWIIQLNKNGQIVWNKTYGGSGSDFCFNLERTSNGVIATGYTTSNDIPGYHGGGDFWLLKLTNK